MITEFRQLMSCQNSVKRKFLASTSRPVSGAPLTCPRTALTDTTHHLVNGTGLYREFSVVAPRAGIGLPPDNRGAAVTG